MSDTTSGLTDERATPFVDPWSKKPNHQGVVPVDALFVGAWDNDLGIDNINEALFLVRDDQQDRLWSLTTYSEKTTRTNLAARAMAPRARARRVKRRRSFWTRSCVQGFLTSSHDRHICQVSSRAMNCLTSREQSSTS